MTKKIQKLKERANKCFDAQYELMETAGLTPSVKTFAQQENRKQKLQVIERLYKMQEDLQTITTMIEGIENLLDKPVLTLDEME